jgi:HAD superfamily hydrolase (TIGR01549 family)
VPRFRAILFDLCDTLVHFDAERLPLVEIDNQPTRTTARAVYAAIGPSPPVDFDGFFACLKAVTSEIAAQREADHREVTSQERFRRLLDRLGLAASPREAVRLVEAHMTRLAEALVTPEHHPRVLATLAERYRLGVVTNFDHAPTVRSILLRDGLDSYFDTVIISSEIGWRKPHGTMFGTAIERLGIPAADALFVGDNFELDVVGASRAGLTAVWYQRGAREMPHHGHHAISDLAELPRLLDA